MGIRNTRHLQRSILSTALISALFLSANAAAQENPQNQNATAPDKAVDLDRVMVTGSRIKRSEIEGPSPVTIISAQQIEKEGFTTVFDVLNTLSQNNGTVQNELNSNGGFTPNGSPVNLRGLGPGRTLLLINGRRAADYPFPYNGQSNFQNFGNVPAAAVDRIELLAGGASAIYGSDAVAGVVNVVLKTNFDGDVAKVRAGTTTEGGGDFVDFQWVGGRKGDRWSVTYALEHFSDETVYGYQRDFMDSMDDNPRPDPIIGFNVPDNTLRLRPSAGATTPNSYISPPPGACESFGGELERTTFYTVNTSDQVVRLGEACGYWKRPAYQSIANGNNDTSGYLYGTFDFTDHLQGWASAMGYHSKSNLTGGLETITGPAIDGSVLVRGTGPFSSWRDPSFNNTTMSMRRIITPQEYGGIENTLQHFTEKSLDVAFGLRGTIADRFDWDFTIGRADYKATRTRPRLDASAMTDWFFGPLLGYTSASKSTPIYRLNREHFYTPLTPEQYRSMSSILRYEAHSWVNQANTTLSGDLFDLPAGPLAFAAVLEGTSQGYDLNSPDGILPTVRTVYNLTGTNGGGERDRYAVGLELSVPILDSLKASLASRYDKYDDITEVEDARTYGLGLEWRPFTSLLVRGNYATSFKAPDMHYVFNEGSGSFSTILDVYRCLEAGGTAGSARCNGPVYNYSAFATSKGEPSLEEETGKSWSAGIVWDFAEGASLTLDYWDIELEGAVTTLSSTFILDNEAGCLTGRTRTGQPYASPGDAFCQEVISRVTRAPEDGQPIGRISAIRSGPVNQSFRHVKGIDAGARWAFSAGDYGDFRLSVDYSHTLQHERQLLATDPVESDWRDSKNNFDFRSRVRGSLGWSKGDWEANLFGSRYGSLPNWQETGRIAPYILWNGNVSKSITDKMRLTFFVNNIFNNFHPKDDGFDTYPYFYDSFSPIGREVSAEITYKFR